MDQKNSTIVMSPIVMMVVFLLGLGVLLAAWLYSGHLWPVKPPPSSTDYDKSGFYMEIGIWVATLVSGVGLLLRAVAKARER